VALRVRELTDEEQETIKQLARSRTAPARLVERARIIELARQGWRVPAIAMEVRLHEQTVRQWLTRFNAAGLDGLGDAPRPGRPATYTAEQVGEVIATALRDPQTLGLPFGCWTLDRLEAYLNEERALPIKRSRIDELLIAEGLRWRSQETWFGGQAALVPSADQETPSPTPIKKTEREVAPDFAQKRVHIRCQALPGAGQGLGAVRAAGS
jgi:transposase